MCNYKHISEPANPAPTWWKHQAEDVAQVAQALGAVPSAQGCADLYMVAAPCQLLCDMLHGVQWGRVLAGRGQQLTGNGSCWLASEDRIYVGAQLCAWGRGVKEKLEARYQVAHFLHV
jgi:hypothetical protein